MRPLALITRYQGKPREAGVCRNTVPTNRARRGKPATSATLPYVHTRPRGICLMAAMILAASLGAATACVLAFFNFCVADLATTSLRAATCACLVLGLRPAAPLAFFFLLVTSGL